MNKCARCGEILAGNFETVHVLDGELYCSKEHAIEMVMIAEGTDRETAEKAYYRGAEEVYAEEILAEDFNEVFVVFLATKRIKVPKNVGCTVKELKAYANDQFVVTVTDVFGNELKDMDITMGADLVG